jgi:putative serine protease XkdF
MSFELCDIDVEIVSLVDKAANQRTLIWKRKQLTEQPSFERNFQIKKIDEEKKLVYGVVYAPGDPNDTDVHKDFATAEEIEKAAHRFLAKSKTDAADRNHDCEIGKGLKIVESAILKGTHEYLPDEKAGAWYMCMKVEDDDTWEKVKKGEFTGFSMYGTAKRIEKSFDTEGFVKSVFKKIAAAFQEEPELETQDRLIKDFNETYSKMQFRTVGDALCCEIWNIMYNDMLSLEQKRDEVLKVLTQAADLYNSIDLAKSEVKKAGKTISAASMKKLTAALDALQSLVDSSDKAAEKRAEIEKISNKHKSTEGDTTVDEKLKKEYDDKATAAEAEIKKLKEENEKLSKASAGSKQVTDDTEGNKGTEVKKAVFPWVTGA